MARHVIDPFTLFFLFTQVVSVTTYGAFVKIAGYRKQGKVGELARCVFSFKAMQMNTHIIILCLFVFASSGLVHKSEMSACRVDNPSEIVDVGEQVWIKVIGKEVHSICMYACHCILIYQH